MVYAVPNNRPIVSKTPLKTTRVQGEHSKKMEELIKTHNIIAGRNSNGDTFIEAVSKWTLLLA